MGTKKLVQKSYGPDDIVDEKNPIEWFLSVLRLCYDASYEAIGTDSHYVTHAWNLLDLKIRLALTPRTEDMIPLIMTVRQ